ncbi:MAG: M20/M25/M40 family metallo-hydrolase [Actinomycetota bacterium]|nr:M20/M25/M40 family metallo-hydrolase [Actinomycetota bacterium]
MSHPDVVSLFMELASIPSPPGRERDVADRVVAYLRSLGVAVDEDDAGTRIGASAGNLLARLEPTDGAGAAICLCAHLDTVPPTAAIDPVLADGVIRNAQETILGADNKAAVAVMLEAVRRVREEGRAHAGIELVFTPKEETGLEGAKELDVGRLAADVGFVYDHAAPIGAVVAVAPSSVSIDAVFRGRAAHAGMHPEEGRSAVAAAARAIADLRLGRIDDETTANVGVIAGGTARNIVPDHCVVEAEARSRDEAKLAEVVQEMADSFAFAGSLAECDVDVQLEEKYRGYRFRPDDPPLRLAFAALERSGFEPRAIEAGGGADANVFNARGLPCANLANGMARIHSAEEHITVADLEAMVDVTLALVDAARNG